MRKRVTFFLVCEGTSDEALVEHLETLVARQGVDEVLGIPRSGTGSVHEKIRALGEEGTAFDFVVVHRDADQRDPTPRIAEVEAALREARLPGCPVVPVQMTEAWLLLDESAIRAVVGRPSGREPLDLPKLHEIEGTHDSKAVLKRALLAAAGGTGRRHKKAVREWSTYRRILLQRLDVDGPVSQLPSWQRMVDDLARVVHDIAGAKDT